MDRRTDLVKQYRSVRDYARRRRNKNWANSAVVSHNSKKSSKFVDNILSHPIHLVKNTTHLADIIC